VKLSLTFNLSLVSFLTSNFEVSPASQFEIARFYDHVVQADIMYGCFCKVFQNKTSLVTALLRLFRAGVLMYLFIKRFFKMSTPLSYHRLIDFMGVCFLFALACTPQKEEKQGAGKELTDSESKAILVNIYPELNGADSLFAKASKLAASNQYVESNNHFEQARAIYEKIVMSSDEDAVWGKYIRCTNVLA